MTAPRPISGAAPRRRAPGRFAPVSAAPAGFLLFAVWYFRLNAALAGLRAVAGLAVLATGRPVAPELAALPAWATLVGVAVEVVQAALFLWVAHLLARRQPLGAYLTLGLTGLSLAAVLAFGRGGPFALVIPALGVLVAVGAWRELRRDEAPER